MNNVAAGAAPETARDAVPSQAHSNSEQNFGAVMLASFVAVDPKSITLLEQVKKIAASSSTVLIRGESGVGKDLLASMLHYLALHTGNEDPLLKIDCASLPHELMESELFGYERGAFTGASQMKRGRLEMAGSGTIVLDEIAALSMPMQAKLLRVIEEKKFDRLGGTRSITLAEHVRIVAITNIDLEYAVARRTFRKDLYYRLNVIPLVVPPLRERRADIRPLAQRFAKLLAEVHRKPQKKIAEPALAALEQYAFPGNVRELRNMIERCVVHATSAEIQLEHLPAHVSNAATSSGAKLSLQEVERAYIAEVLDFCRGKKSKAAEILGISRKTLLEKRKRYKLDN